MVVTAKDFMTKEVVMIEINKSALDAAKLLTARDVGSLVVVRDGKAVGILTDRDIVIRAVSLGINVEKVKIGDIMSRPIVTVDPDTPVIEVAKLMEQHSIRRVPVVENEKVVGIVTVSDMGRASKVLAPYLVSRISEIYLGPKT